MHDDRAMKEDCASKLAAALDEVEEGDSRRAFEAYAEFLVCPDRDTCGGAQSCERRVDELKTTLRWSLHLQDD
ncbi:MAG: hypothetical protein H6907_07320 [Hyphomicrobiales bacterium]|nr:hypothetical protein [Hyphomicrobiales bacterium]MCP5371532.1 hypothetical protein [Hyphomicrobiales bacterium]